MEHLLQFYFNDLCTLQHHFLEYKDTQAENISRYLKYCYEERPN